MTNLGAFGLGSILIKLKYALKDWWVQKVRASGTKSTSTWYKKYEHRVQKVQVPTMMLTLLTMCTYVSCAYLIRYKSIAVLTISVFGPICTTNKFATTSSSSTMLVKSVAHRVCCSLRLIIIIHYHLFTNNSSSVSSSLCLELRLRFNYFLNCGGNFQGRCVNLNRLSLFGLLSGCKPNVISVR